MGPVFWFLGVYFEWTVMPKRLSAHLSQEGFVTKLLEQTWAHRLQLFPDALPVRIRD
jgi:hypothetical protein